MPFASHVKEKICKVFSSTSIIVWCILWFAGVILRQEREQSHQAEPQTVVVVMAKNVYAAASSS